MKRDLARSLRKEFEAEMGKRCPSFSLRRDIRVPSGDLVFSASPLKGLTFFVILELDRDWDAFNINLAWNAGSDELPRLLGMLPSEAPFQRQHRFPLHRLADSSAEQHPWYWQVVPIPVLGDSAAWASSERDESGLVDRARELVREAVNQLVELGLPYFESITRRAFAGEV
jgi:hypothetical protein